MDGEREWMLSRLLFADVHSVSGGVGKTTAVPRSGVGKGVQTIGCV